MVDINHEWVQFPTGDYGICQNNLVERDEMRRMIVFVLLLALVTLACDMSSVAPMPTLMPTLVVQQTTIYPTAEVYVPPVVVAPQTSSFLSNARQVLESSGFYQDNYQCNVACDSYTYNGASDVYVSAFVYHDNTFSLTTSVAEGMNVATEGRVLAKVMYGLYGEAVANWVSAHMDESVYSDQSGYAGGHSLDEVVRQGNNGSILIIEVDF
jgi:hypothetical protein